MPTAKRLIIALGCLLLFPLAAHGGLVPGNLDYRTIETEHFRIHYEQGYGETAQKAAKIFEEMYVLLGKEFNVYPPLRTDVVLTDQHDKANGFATVIPYNMVIIRLTPPVAGSTLAYYGDDYLRLLIAHEYVHVLNLSDAGYPAKLLKFLLGKIVAPNALAPTWITEGMATYFETAVTGYGRGRSSYAEMLVRTDIIRGKFLTIDKAAGSMYEWPSWQAGYIYGVAFWNYLTETYGRDKIVEFSHKYGASLWFFSLNNKAKRVFGKYWYQLWRDWKEHLEEKYSAEIAAYQAKAHIGETELSVKDSILTAPAWSPDGSRLAYVESSPDVGKQVRIVNPDGKDEVLIKRRAPAQLSWSPDGQQLAYTSIGNNKRGFFYNDLYVYDFETKKSKALTRGKRTRDATYSPDGQRIAVSVHEMDRDQIGIYDLSTKELTLIGEPPAGTRIDHLNWSPINNHIAASVRQPDGQRQIVVFDDNGKAMRTVSRGKHTNIYPRWSPDGRYLYYTSDRGNIFNIYRYDWKTKRTGQVTAALTGAFSAAPQPATGMLSYQYYNGNGYEIRELLGAPYRELSNKELESGGKDTMPLMQPSLETIEEASQEPFTDKPYSPPAITLLPHRIQPNVLFLDGDLLINALVGSQDPLARHVWTGFISYRTDANFLGGGGYYQYNRYPVKPFIGFADFAVNYGDLFRVGSNYYEERRRANAGVRAFLKGGHVISGQYLFEHRSAESTIPAGVTPQPVLGRYAGLRFGYRWNMRKKLPAAISPEDAYYIHARVDVTDKIFGGSENMEQVVIESDTRQYVKMPWSEHHVLAFRQALGLALRDQLTQGTFAVGGSVGESAITATSARQFNLRGLPLNTFLRDRALVLTAEYRMPLFSAQRGIGTWPIFLNQVQLNIFADYGRAWNRGQTPTVKDFFDDFLLGVGAELAGHFVIGYHVPIMARLGYGIIVLNRDIVARVKDPLLGNTINNGILILNLGTSF